MSTAPTGPRPLRLQTRLMAAVIGIVGLILVVVTAITSVTLSITLEARLSEQLDGSLRTARQWTALLQAQDVAHQINEPVTAPRVLDGRSVPHGMVLVLAPVGGEVSGAYVSPEDGRIRDLSDSELRTIAQALATHSSATVSIGDLGSYRISGVESSSGAVTVVGLPRADNQRTLSALFTTIALATIGGLILLATTTALTIRMSLRPLRAVAATATRVADQPLASGAVSITERVPTEQADPRTETGAVGAALNVLLDHVDTSLAARQQKEEQMRRFVADASHELRTPLASIRGYSELSLKAMQNDASDSETTRTALERIHAQSLRMTRLVEDLLLLARLDEGRELVHGTVDLTRLAVEALGDAQPTGPAHHWAIDVPETPVLIAADSGRLHQVVANLLANARTHTPEGTTITVRVSQEPDAAVLQVSDNGPGIDPKVQPELFSRFARGDVSRARQTGGTGLGLAIAKAIVDGHNGEITVDSGPGGTTFTVRLPAASPR